MTRREWLTKNPPPQSNGELLDRAEKLDQDAAQDKADGPRLGAIAQELRADAAKAPGRCPLHPQARLYRHMNRIEDLFVCKQGPHFLLWSSLGGRAQFIPLAKLDLPGLDEEMR